MDSYFSVSGQTVTQKTIEKSRFITTLCHVENEQEARQFIAETSKKYGDATHNCYAFIGDTLGNLLRFSDDGEPQGTAGMPMLDVLRAQELCQVAVVVTRYFGGIKLGAGGLVRAYSGCVAEACKAAQKVCYEPCVQCRVTTGYSYVEGALKFFGERGANLKETLYENDVTFVVVIPQRQAELFASDLINKLNGRVTVKREGEFFAPFPIEAK